MTTLVALADVLSLLGAIALAAFGGEAFLKGILGIAAHSRLPRMLVAVTLAAFATCSPELTVSTMAALGGKPEIGLGTLLGSNLFNGLGIAGTASSIHPIRAPVNEVAVALLFGLLTVLWVLPRRGKLSPRRGWVMSPCIVTLNL